MTTVVGPKGQVVIEKPIREALGIVPGDLAVQRVVGDRVEIRFYRSEHDDSLRGVLTPLIRRHVDPDDWPEALEAAWAAAARDSESVVE